MRYTLGSLQLLHILWLYVVLVCQLASFGYYYHSPKTCIPFLAPPAWPAYAERSPASCHASQCLADHCVLRRTVDATALWPRAKASHICSRSSSPPHPPMVGIGCHAVSVAGACGCKYIVKQYCFAISLRLLVACQALLDNNSEPIEVETVQYAILRAYKDDAVSASRRERTGENG
jgi:hypothetical protein